MAKQFTSNNQTFEEKQEEWTEIENHVFAYQKQFADDATKEEIEIAKQSALTLITKFNPLFKKYMMLLKTGQIDYYDSDIKMFVYTFIDDPRLLGALKREKSRSEFRTGINQKFGFVLETYGKIPEDEMLLDMQFLLLILAQRYKPVGKNFCAYVHNVFRFEVSRHIKKFIANPMNIVYKNTMYEDSNTKNEEDNYESVYEDIYYEPENGIPNMNWISGDTCSDVFNVLTSLERKIIVKYYAEEYNDKQIAESLGLHINTVNQKRRIAVSKVASQLDINIADVVRSRHSGRQPAK